MHSKPLLKTIVLNISRINVDFLADILSDAIINSLISERKHLDSGFRISDLRFRSEKGHKRYNKELVGDNGSNFVLKIRQSEKNSLDFSIILVYEGFSSNKEYRLRRYNGAHCSSHTNPIEGDTIEPRSPHIHYATERYQRLGFNEDQYAKATDKYTDIDGALKCMITDCNFAFTQTVIMP